MGLYARYVGDGEFYAGIPRRDLGDEDLEQLDESQRVLVDASPLYERVAHGDLTEAPAQRPPDHEEGA